jgi:hypothetical protein
MNNQIETAIAPPAYSTSLLIHVRAHLKMEIHGQQKRGKSARINAFKILGIERNRLFPTEDLLEGISKILSARTPA